MILNEVIFDLELPGGSNFSSYEAMVENWYVEVENNPIPTLELCIETWNNTSLSRLTAQRKQECIVEVKQIANQLLQETDWKITKQIESNNTAYTHQQWVVIIADRQELRKRSDEIEAEILALNTLDAVNSYIIQF